MHHKPGHFSFTNYLFSADFGCSLPKILIRLHDFVRVHCKVFFHFLFIYGTSYLDDNVSPFYNNAGL